MYSRYEHFFIRWMLGLFQRSVLLKIVAACGIALLPSRVSMKLYDSVVLWLLLLSFRLSNAACYIPLLIS